MHRPESVVENETHKPLWDFEIQTDQYMLEQKGKTTQVKQTIQLEEIKQKVLAKEGRLKRYRDRGKQYRQYRTFQNNENNSISE